MNNKDMINKQLYNYNLSSVNLNKGPCWPISDACKKCSSHPINGGKGVCNCILGLIPIKN